MKLTKKLNSKGFEHVTVLVLFLVAFALLGVYLLVKSHANSCDTSGSVSASEVSGSCTTSGSGTPGGSNAPTMTIATGCSSIRVTLSTTLPHKGYSLAMISTPVNLNDPRYSRDTTENSATFDVPNSAELKGKNLVVNGSLTFSNGSTSVGAHQNITAPNCSDPMPPPVPEKCALDQSLLKSDPKCTPCQYNASIIASNPACKAPVPPVPEKCALDQSLLKSDPKCTPCQYNASIIASNPACKAPVPPPPTGKPIVGIGSGKCLDVVGGATGNGARIQIWNCNGSSQQKWTIKSDGTIVGSSGRCLDATSSGIFNGAYVQLWDCKGTSNQKWVINSNKSICSVASKRCLDVTNRSNANGARVQVWIYFGTNNQRWNT